MRSTNCTLYFMRWWSGVLLRMSGCWLELLLPMPMPPDPLTLMLPVPPCDEFSVCECIPCELIVLWAVVHAVDGAIGRDLCVFVFLCARVYWRGVKSMEYMHWVKFNSFSFSLNLLEHTYLMLRWLPFRVSVFICGVPGHVWPNAFM